MPPRARWLVLSAAVLLLALQSASAQGPASSRPQLVPQTGHSSGVQAVAFSPDGRWLASGSSDNTVRIWDRATGRELRTLRGHTFFVASVAFSPDGGLLASGSWDRTVRLWDVASGRELRTLVGHTEPIASVAFSPDGRWLASASWDNTIRLWEVARGAEARTFRGSGKSMFDGVAFSPDGRQLASADRDWTIEIWDVATGREARILGMHQGPVASVAFSPDGRWLASASWDKTVKLWDVAAGRELRTLSGHSLHVTSVAFSPDGQRLASASLDKSIRVWEVPSGREVFDLRGHAEAVESITFSPDGRWLASASDDHTIKVWQAASGREALTLGGRSSWIGSVAPSPDGHWLAVGSFDATIKFWDLATGSQLRVLNGHTDPVHSVVFSPDGRWLASGSGVPLGKEGAINLWETSAGRKIRTLTSHAAEITSLAFSPDGRWLASGSDDQTIKLWQAADGREVRTLRGHEGAVSSLAFSPNGRWLASGSLDGSIQLWEAATGRKLRTFPGYTVVSSIAFSPDGRRLASAGVALTLWEVATGRKLRTFGGDSDDVMEVAFSPDGRWLASGNFDQTLKLWQVATGRATRTLRGHNDLIASVAFSPDGRWLVSGGSDGTTRLWDFERGDLLATLVSMSNSAEWLVVAPDGLFDGSPQAWSAVLWRFGPNLTDVAAAELFFNEYYYPGLLADILAGKHPKAKTDIANLDRRQPEVKLSLAGGRAAGAAVAERRVKVTVEVQEAPAEQQHPAGSGAQDVRLFRNGTLVKMWHGEVKLDKDGKATLEAEVTLVAGENKLTAYAFNHDNIKSSDATLSVTGADSLQRPGTAYILAVGINQYAASDFNLRYAAADAQDFTAEIEKQQKKLGKYAKVEVTSLEDQQATKANLLAALKHLAEVAQPEDAVFIYYAGHGTASGPRFYLIPHDLGYAGGRDQLDEAALKSVLGHSVSDLELDQAFESIDAGEIVLVIDACRSGQALQADDPRQGPMNSKGLAQLAYEKGMYILTASQGYQAALEASSYGHGLLTYALVEEGLKSAKADDEPKDGQVTLREWLDYASQEVPQLELQLMQAARTRGVEIAIVEGEQKIEELEKRSLQRPRVFYRREPEAQPFVVAKP